MNSSYLLIEITNDVMLYAVRKSDVDSIYFISEKNILSFSNVKDDFKAFCDTVLQNVVMLMKNKGYSYNNTRVYLRSSVGIDSEDKRQLRNALYITAGVNLNFLTDDLEKFYMCSQPEINDGSVICGIARQELRRVVLCGSFRKYLDEVKKVYQYCMKNGIEVLSPQNLVLEDMYNDNFALFHGEHIVDERETYLIESKHTDSIEKADAIIVCNPDGYIGSRTLYEIGYADSQGKRIIFLYNERNDFDICFPRDYGLIGFDLTY